MDSSLCRYVWAHSGMHNCISITSGACWTTPKSWGIETWTTPHLGSIAETLHWALGQWDTQLLPAAQHWWGWTRACSTSASHKGHACPPLEARLCSTVNMSWVSSSVIRIFHSLTLCCRPTQILGVRQPAMTVVEELSGFLLSSDPGRSSILLYYYTTFPCVCQLFLSYRKLYSFQTSLNESSEKE